MPVQFTHPYWLLALVPALLWVVRVGWRSDVSLSAWRRAATFVMRIIITVAVIAALAGIQLRRPVDAMNVFFLLDRSDSIPSVQQEAALRYVNETTRRKELRDQAGVLVFAAESALETTASPVLDLQRINAVVSSERTDIGAAIRLASAAFPETGQKRMVLISDGNENMGDAVVAVLAAKSLGVTLDVLPRGVERSGDVSIEKITLPNRLKKGQVFEPKVFIQSSQSQAGLLRIYRDDRLLAEQPIQLSPGKNLFSFSQQLDDAGFYRYDAQLEVPGDSLPQNNRGTGFTGVRGEPRILMLTSDPTRDETLVAALRAARLEVQVREIIRMPTSLAELQSYESILLSNVAAGDLSREGLNLLETLVHDFGVGIICVGGDQSFTAGGYRGTPLETILPVSMELDSKKVLPKGAVVLVMHGMEFANGNQIARDCAIGVLEALAPQDEMGVVLWDGVVRWLFELGPVGDKLVAGRAIAGMNQGDLPSFQEVMNRGYQALSQSTANLKHMIVFSDGDPGPPSDSLMEDIRKARITVSTVLIAGHAGPDTMMSIATKGNGRFYNVSSPDQLPQIFLKETAVILKSAIFEDPFKPQLAAGSELIRGISGNEFPTLKGYVCTSPKPRAEIPLVSDKGDPILAHWQYGLGRAVAFTSDARNKWASDWLSWQRYQQFWSQVAQWSLRRLESAEFNTEVQLDKGEGVVTVEALDDQGNYRNFLNLQAVVVGPKGDRQVARLDQTSAGRYQLRFAAREVGAYVLNILELRDGQVRASQVIGSSVSFSPEFADPNPNTALLHRLADLGGGKVLDSQNPADDPFHLGRERTFQPQDLWEWLLKSAMLLFTLDVGLRRIQLDPDEVRRAWFAMRRRVLFWSRGPVETKSEESLASLLARRDEVRSRQASVTPPNIDPALFQPARPQSPPVLVSTSISPTPPNPSQNPPKAAGTPSPESTASRLLEAKRKARKKSGI